jgi:glycosyltransferase involved in cell wall biosynthesis
MVRDENVPLRVLHLASWYPTTVHETLGNFVQRHVEAVATLHRCTVLTAVADGGVAGRAERRYEEREPAGVREPAGGGWTIEEHRIHLRPRRPQGWWVGQALWEYGRTLERPDLVHLHVMYPAGRAARRLAREWGVPLVVTEHWTGYQRPAWDRVPGWRRWDMGRTGAAADCICPVTADLGETMQSAGVGRGRRFRPVPNVVDTRLFHPREAPPGPNLPTSEAQELTLLHISSLADHHKNLSGLLRALAQCLPDLPRVRVRIFGGGDPADLQRLARDLGIADRIHWGAEISLSEVAREMREADALVLFSHFENFPCVIGEAWASGIPVFATDVGGIREYLDETRGVLLPAGDEMGLASALRVWAQGKQWDGGRLRATAVEHFSVDAVARQFDAVYREVLGLPQLSAT